MQLSVVSASEFRVISYLQSCLIFSYFMKGLAPEQGKEASFSVLAKYIVIMSKIHCHAEIYPVHQ